MTLGLLNNFMKKFIYKITVFLLMFLTPNLAFAEVISNPVAAFAGLDKITGRLIKFDVYMNETVQFGALRLTPRACYTEPATKRQRIIVFLEVDQINLEGNATQIFSGWMFADSPSLNAIDHAIYDVWLENCKQSSDTVPPPNKVTPPSDVAPLENQ